MSAPTTTAMIATRVHREAVDSLPEHARRDQLPKALGPRWPLALDEPAWWAAFAAGLAAVVGRGR